MIRRSFAVACIALMLGVTTTGCLGGMALSGKVRQWNLDVAEGSWTREAVFLLLYLVPVYPFAAGIDLLIVNSIEFHTGTNPLSGKPRVARAGESWREVAPDGTVVVSTLREDGSIDFVVTLPDGSAQHLNLRERGDRLVARNADGDVLAAVSREGPARSVRTVR